MDLQQMGIFWICTVLNGTRELTIIVLVVYFVTENKSVFCHRANKIK